jgi:hypothetical protein
MYQENKTKWSYLAGLIDGEGCISISKRIAEGKKVSEEHGNPIPYKIFTLRISITNTSVVLMKWLIKNFGGVYYSKYAESDKHKARYEWRPKGRANTEKMLLAILPYMVIKTEQVKNALEWFRMTNNKERNPEKREKMYLANRLLNQKGNSVTTNTLDSPENGLMIESDLISDNESAPLVTVDA